MPARQHGALETSLSAGGYPGYQSLVLLSSDSLRAVAREAGFDLCGFARAEPIPPEHLVGWLEAGMAADMDWLERRLAERLDPSKIVPGARTVVAFACNYYRDDEGTRRSPIAKYARGRDYHYTLQDRLRAFRRGLVALYPGVKTFSCVDSGPLMEKVWAARAGLGYVGHNGCLITEAYGSYVLLATMILDAEVDAYAGGPSLDRCGSCRLCVMACPTDAITLDRRVDARLCLSYQNIENEAPIPEPLRAKMGGHVFGCDICQDVCPLNRTPVLGGDRFAPRAVAQLDVRAIAAMTPEEYQKLIPGTPLGRAKYDGLRRNALYALGAVRDREARPLIERLTQDSSERVSSAAWWALSRLA